MKKKVKKLTYKKDYVYEIIFEDKKRAEVNFRPYLWGNAFSDLMDKTEFKKAYIDKTSGTIAWPNGADIAPETLYRIAATS